jgi:hypothetical protein
MVFGEAAGAIVPMANAASNGSHFVITFVNSPPSICSASCLYTLESCPRSKDIFRILQARISLANHFLRSFAMTTTRSTTSKILTAIRQTFRRASSAQLILSFQFTKSTGVATFDFAIPCKF